MMFHFQILLVSLLVSSSLACAPSCPSRVVPRTCPTCPVGSCTPKEHWSLAECALKFSGCVPATITENEMSCPTGKRMAFVTADNMSGMRFIVRNALCAKSGSSGQWIYFLLDGNPTLPRYNIAKIACVN